MAFYQLTATYTIFVEADSEDEAIEQFEADLENDPVYGPFDYNVVECPEGFPC